MYVYCFNCFSAFCFSYELDPNDGYASRIPQNAYRLTKHRHHYPGEKLNRYSPYRTIQLVPSSTPIPVKITTSEPDYKYQKASPVQDYVVTSESPILGPVTTQATRQHLTETTQIQGPTLSTYVPPYHKQYTDGYKFSKLSSLPKFKPITTLKPTNLVYGRPTIEYPVLTHQNLTSFNSSLAIILKKLQQANQLPQTITPDNIDYSIKTLVKILNNLKSQHVSEPPSQHYSEDGDYPDESDHHSPITCMSLLLTF